MSDAPYLPDDFLAEVSRWCQMATPGPWRMEAADADGNPAPRVVGPDGEPLLELVVPDDPERVRDIGYDVAFAVAARSAMPVLIAEVVRLKADLAEAVATLNRLLNAIHGKEDFERRTAEGIAAVIRERSRDQGGAGRGDGLRPPDDEGRDEGHSL